MTTDKRAPEIDDLLVMDALGQLMQCKSAFTALKADAEKLAYILAACAVAIPEPFVSDVREALAEWRKKWGKDGN